MTDQLVPQEDGGPGTQAGIEGHVVLWGFASGSGRRRPRRWPLWNCPLLDLKSEVLNQWELNTEKWGPLEFSVLLTSLRGLCEVCIHRTTFPAIVCCSGLIAHYSALDQSGSFCPTLLAIMKQRWFICMFLVGSNVQSDIGELVRSSSQTPPGRRLGYCLWMFSARLISSCHKWVGAKNRSLSGWW